MNNVVQFGAPLGSVFDNASKRAVQIRCMGTAHAAHELAPDVKTNARACLIKVTAAEIQRALDAGAPLITLVRSTDLATKIGAAATAELGIKMEVESVMLGMSDEDAQAIAQVAIAQAPPPQPTARSCPQCGAPAGGKFCQSCGAAQTQAAPAPAPAPSAQTSVEPPPGEYLTSGINRPIAAGARVTVHPNHCFVGFVNGAIACNLQAGVHVLPQACDSGVYIRLAGLHFARTMSVRGHGRMELRGAMYMQDPVQAFRSMQTIDESYVGILEIVLGRSADQAAQTAGDERQLCLGTAHLYAQAPEAIAGTVVVLESMRPVSA